MGMFDYVKFKMDCPVCGELIDDFQTKDGENMLETLRVGDVDNFYSFCENCGTWVDFELKRRGFTIKDYRMTIQKNRIKPLEERMRLRRSDKKRG